MKHFFLASFFLVAGTSAVFAADQITLRAAPEGGFFVEKANKATGAINATGIASVQSLDALAQTAAADIDFAKGETLEGNFEIVVAREDGTLGRYRLSGNVTIFAQPDTVDQAGDMTTLKGAVIFKLKPEEQQRLDQGTITLTRLVDEDV